MPANGGSSLREMLGVSKDPEFYLKLLDGWERHAPGDADRDAIDAQLKARCMAAHRPDLHATFRTQLDQAFTRMKQQNVIAYFAATGETTSKAYIPGTMFATVRRSPTGESRPAKEPETMIATPARTAKITAQVARETVSRKNNQPSSAATRGTAALISNTFFTVWHFFLPL